MEGTTPAFDPAEKSGGTIQLVGIQVSGIPGVGARLTRAKSVRAGSMGSILVGAKPGSITAGRGSGSRVGFSGRGASKPPLASATGITLQTSWAQVCGRAATFGAWRGAAPE
jgi:hypothetical protein